MEFNLMELLFSALNIGEGAWYILLILIVVLAGGFLLLIKGADFLVDGSASLAKRAKVPEIVIGLTIVAFGTSAPELIVNIFSSISGHNDVVFGNIIGSNIFNIALILGISGLIKPLMVQKNTVWREIPFSLLAVLVLFVVVNDKMLGDAASNNILSRGDGLIFIGFFIIFLVYVFIISKVEASDGPDVKLLSILKTTLFIIFGFVGLFVGGKLVVDSAVKIAEFFKVSEKLIALTIVSAGTSLPELVTSAVAAKKGYNDIAIGNIVGSNIFNIFLILGISAIIRPAAYDAALNIDIYVLIFVTLLLFIFMFTGKTRRLDRWEAALFLLTYGGYLAFLIYRR